MNKLQLGVIMCKNDIGSFWQLLGLRGFRKIRTSLVVYEKISTFSGGPKSAGTSFAVLTAIYYRCFCNMVEIDNQRTRRKTTLQNTSSLADVASTAVRCHLCPNIAMKELLDFGV